MSRTFGTIRQLGFVVTDIHAAIRQWIDCLGVGPFFYVDHQPVNDFSFRGLASSPDFSVALAQTGFLQIELIQQHNDEPSAFKEFIDTGSEGLQHVAYWTTHFDELTATVLASGHTELQAGRSGSGGPDERFAYFTSNGHRGTVVEVSEVSGPKAALFEAVAAASLAWDGTDPVRDMTSLVTA